MRGRTTGAVLVAACVGALALPAAASASDENPGKPEIGTCKTQVDKVKAKPNGKSAREKKAAKKKADDGGNQQAFTSGITVLCT